MSDGRDDGDDNGWHARCRFVVVVAASNLRNERQSRHGDDAEPGVYQLAEDAVRLLSRNWLEPLPLMQPITITGVRPIARSEQMRRQNISMLAITLECRAPVGSFDAAFGEFRTLHVDWDVPVIGNVAPPLPADDPDAEDLIEVPQDD